MAHLLNTVKTDRRRPSWSRSRLSLSWAGDGRGEISTHVHRQDPHAPPYTSKHSRRNCENFSRGRSLVWACPLRSSPSLDGLDRNDRDDSRFAFWNLRSACNCLASLRTRRATNHGRAAEFDVTRRILGTTLERPLQSTRIRKYLSARRPQHRPDSRHHRCLPRVWFDSRTRDFAAGAHRLRTTNRVFLAARLQRHHSTSRPKDSPWNGWPILHRFRRGSPGVLAFSSAVRSHCHSAVYESNRSFMKALLEFAAALQWSILIASALTPRVLNWRTNLADLHPFLRKLFWVYGAFIVMVIIAFSTLTLLHADAMATREPVARSLCVFIAIFWGARLFVQFTIFDPRPFLTNWFYQFGYHALTVVFAFLLFVYG